MIRRPPRSTQSRSSAASDVYKRQTHYRANWPSRPSSNSSTSRPRRITIAKNFVIAEYSYILQFGLSALLGLYEDLSDFSCVEFSGKTFRYFVHNHNSSAQLFRGCYLTGDVIHDLFFRRRLSVLRNNNGGGKFTGVIVGKTCHARVEDVGAVSYTHLRAHETRHDLVCRLLLEKKKTRKDC